MSSSKLSSTFFIFFSWDLTFLFTYRRTPEVVTSHVTAACYDRITMPEDHVRVFPLPRPSPEDQPVLVPARMINEVLYCERLMYLEWIQGEFADNAYTVEGRAVHTHVDRRGGTLPALTSDDEGDEPTSERPYAARAVWLSSSRLGITAKMDLVEGEGRAVVPVEYKRGKKPDLPEGAYLPERAQLCAQVLLLREHGYTCAEAAIYYAGDRQRVAIAINEELIDATLAAVRRARQLAAQDALPPPLVDSPKCNGCSLVGICLPDEVNFLRELDVTPSEEDATHQVIELRRLYPTRDDRVPLYVQEEGAFVGLNGENLRVRRRSEADTEARLPNTSQISLLGNVQISSQALRAALARGIPVSFFTYGGWLVGRAIGFDSNNVELRLAQLRGVIDDALCLRLARGFVASKVTNCRTMLRRNHRAPNDSVLAQLARLARRATQAGSLSELLGLEGAAARIYFGDFAGMLREDAADTQQFAFEGRNRRPPRDPLNALLSFAYALLAKDVAVAATTVGLDPLLGFYHQARFGRPALALDLMEEFRPLIADSVVVTAINTGVVRDSDFLRANLAVALKPEARRRLVLAYERRMDQLVTHPVFGYRISYRRVLEVQARLLSRLLLGEIPAYPSFRTR